MNANEPIGLGETQEEQVRAAESLAWRLDLHYLTILALLDWED